MKAFRCMRSGWPVVVLVLLSVGPAVWGQIPDHPVVSEVYTDPNGANDGPVGRDLANLHQEYLEIYLPPAASLSPGLNKDALRLTFYEVEGDESSSGLGLVNYRIDLPTLDLDPSNGLTPGAVARPSSGVLVIGWVNYVGNPPTGLAGTPSTRMALINGGVTSTAGFALVAMNGAQFTGTTNFPVPAAISSIDMPVEASSGIIQNGSAVYLLVNRDDPGYVQLFDDATGLSADPGLPGGSPLQTTCLLDGFASNDDSNFDVLIQPTPSGGIDLATILPPDGPYSLLACQVPESGGNGYARRFVDLQKTTENGIADDPIADATTAYRATANAGPFFATPGRVVFTTTPPELSVAQASLQNFDVLAGTTGRLGVIAANVGGDFAIQLTASPGASSHPAVCTFAGGGAAIVGTGQSFGYPGLEATAPLNATHLATAASLTTVNAINVVGGDPPVVNPSANTTVTARALNPTQGQNAAGQPFQATTFVALHGLPDQPGVPNEFAGTSLAAFVAANLGGLVDDERNNGAVLLAPGTNLSDPILIDVMEDDMPDDPSFFINSPGAPGGDDLAATIMTSAEVLAGNGTYSDIFNSPPTAVRAVELNIAETLTAGGTFMPSEHVYFADARGGAGSPTSGLSNATSARGFELALLDSNVQQAGTLETGRTDDFGLVVRAGRVRAGSSVATDELIFLSFTGGLEGADIDSIDVPPHGNQTVIIYVDLDPLDAVLGVETITQLIVVDGSGSSTLNVIEAFSLNAAPPSPFDADRDGDVDLSDYASFRACMSGPLSFAGSGCSVHDSNADLDVDLSDFAGFQSERCAPCPAFTMLANGVFDNLNGKDYFAGGPEGAAPMLDLRTSAEEGLVEILSTTPANWWEARYEDLASGAVAAVSASVRVRREAGAIGTLVIQVYSSAILQATRSVPVTSLVDTVNLASPPTQLTVDVPSLDGAAASALNALTVRVFVQGGDGKKIYWSYTTVQATGY